MYSSATHMHAARGTKHTCGNEDCGERFYDLNRSPTDCPYCGETFDPAAVTTRHTFEMAAGMRTRGKVYKLTQAPEGDEAPEGVEADLDVEDTADDSDAADILIEDDETEASTDDVIDAPVGSDET